MKTLKTLSAVLLSIALTFSMVASSNALVHAATGDTSTTKTGDTSGTNCQGTTTGLQNPLKGVCSLGDFFYQVANFVYSLSYAVVAFFLILSGFKFVAAQGNEEKLKQAKKTFFNTIIGALLLIGANVITEVVRTVINQFSRTQI